MPGTRKEGRYILTISQNLSIPRGGDRTTRAEQGVGVAVTENFYEGLGPSLDHRWQPCSVNKCEIVLFSCEGIDSNYTLLVQNASVSRNEVLYVNDLIKPLLPLRVRCSYCQWIYERTEAQSYTDRPRRSWGAGLVSA